MEKAIKLLHRLLQERADRCKDLSTKCNKEDGFEEAVREQYLGKCAGLNEAAELVKKYLIDNKDTK